MAEEKMNNLLSQQENFIPEVKIENTSQLSFVYQVHLFSI